MSNIIVQDNSGSSTPIVEPGVPGQQKNSGMPGVPVNVGGPITHAGAAEAAAAAKAHGLSGKALVTAVAIAGAESQYNPDAHCLNCVPGVKEDSRGLWQINVDAHPNFASANLFDPNVNAAAMVAVSDDGTNWHPWSTYTNGAYLAYWPVAAAEVAKLEGGNPILPPAVDPGILAKGAVGVSNAVSDPVGAIASFITGLTNAHTWYRVVLVVGGVAAVLVGVVKLDKSAIAGSAGEAARVAAGSAIGKAVTG